MRKSQIYIEGQKLELFEDEQIKITSSIQDIFNLDATRTDLSYSFTIPASPVNNKIMHHFYNNDVDTFEGVSLNYNVRRNASIEIDLMPFRTGKIQLEKASVINGQAQNYQICFYGDLVSLKDILGETKLSELDYSDYTHLYTESNVISRCVDNTNYDVRYPLITSKRVWDYAGPDNTNNIDVNAGAINVNELFPAIRVSSIMQSIQDYFNITFNSLFFQTKNFTNCYLYLKNKDEFQFKTSTVSMDLISTTDIQYFDLSTNETKLQYLAPTGGQVFMSSTWTVAIDCTPTVTGSNFYIDVYSNNVLLNTVIAQGVGVQNIIQVENVNGLSQNLTFKFRADVVMNIDAQVILQFDAVVNTSGTITTISGSETADASTTVLTGNLDINSNMPDMKVYDFINGIIKEYNLVVYGIGLNAFKFETLENWYGQGNEHDITTYTDVSDITIERVKLYKKISFEHEKSESFMNRTFSDNFAREYGSLQYAFNYDGDELNIKLPFENLLFQQFETTGIQVGYCLTKSPDYKPYIPKPILLNLYDSVSCSPFKFELGTGHVTKTSYLPFGQDLKNNGQNYSLNFGNDISSLLLENVPNSNFMVYYFTYLNNLFKQKNRITYVKTRMPLDLLLSIRLNDRIIIRDKKYIINSMVTNLTNQEVDLVLIHDFRPTKIKTPKPIKNGSLISYPLVFGNGVKKIDVVWTNADTTIDGLTSPITKTSDAILTIDAVRATSIVSIDLKNVYTNGTVEIDKLIIY